MSIGKGMDLVMGLLLKGEILKANLHNINKRLSILHKEKS
jgi:hypothetical protein